MTSLQRNRMARSLKPRTGAWKPRKPLKRASGAKKRRKSKKDTIWTLKRADRAFSEQIRKRDGRCMYALLTFRGMPIVVDRKPQHYYCTRMSMLQCSHYIGRANKSTRYDPENCITLCWLHHYKDKLLGYEYQKQREDTHGYDGRYTLFMRNWLGDEKFAALIERSKIPTKQRAAILKYQNTLSPLKEMEI